MPVALTPRTERVPISRLHPAPWNPRILRDARFKSLCASLQSDPEFLDLRPILATADGTVYGGNQRLRAAMQLGWIEVPAIIADIPDQLARQRALKDNNNWGEWQEDDLAALVYDLGQQGADLATLGFDDKELTRLLDSVGALGEADDGAPDPPAEPITRPGDLWLLGPHRLLCGDATRPEDVARLMDGRRADAVLTDPPYGMDYHGETFGKMGIANDREATFEPTIAGALALLPLDAGPVVICFGTSRLDALFRASEGLRFHRTLSIYKPNCMAHPWHGWLLTSELILLFSRGDAEWFEGQHCHDVYTFDYSERPDKDVDHPTVKPLSIISDVLNKSSRMGDAVYDPFLGSGTTLVAAHQLGRVCYGMEIEPCYVDVAVQRWEHLTGDTARREALA